MTFLRLCNRTEFIYSLFSDKELPAWYTKADLENDKKSIEKLERWAA